MEGRKGCPRRKLEIEKAALEDKITTTERKKMDALWVLQGVCAKEKAAEQDLQRLHGTPSTGMSSQLFLKFGFSLFCWVVVWKMTSFWGGINVVHNKVML